MKKIYIGIMCSFLSLSMNAQQIRGDMDGNGKLDIKDVTELVNTVLGKTSVQTINAVDNSLIAGVWYKSKDESVAFVADGTTNYEGVSHFKYIPTLNYIVLCNSAGQAKGILNAKLLDSETLSINDATIYTRSIPKILVTNIKLNTNKIQLYVDATVQLNATILPADADLKDLVWTSDNEDVVTVTDGLVKAKSIGSATITCKAADGSNKVVSCSVTVTGQGNPGGQVSDGAGA